MSLDIVMYTPYTLRGIALEFCNVHRTSGVSIFAFFFLFLSQDLKHQINSN